MPDRDGSALATTGPVRSSDTRLRRAQARADPSGVALRIVRELISQKLAGQEQVARDGLRNSGIAQAIAEFRATVATAATISAIHHLEARAAAAYWSAWRDLPITFPKSDLRRVPEHWRAFGTRESQLSRSPRLAVNPPNAILNYLYAVLDSEARLAAVALGLDPGLGFLHVDTKTRDSFAIHGIGRRWRNSSEFRRISNQGRGNSARSPLPVLLPHPSRLSLEYVLHTGRRYCARLQRSLEPPNVPLPKE